MLFFNNLLINMKISLFNNKVENFNEIILHKECSSKDFINIIDYIINNKLDIDKNINKIQSSNDDKINLMNKINMEKYENFIALCSYKIILKNNIDYEKYNFVKTQIEYIHNHNILKKKSVDIDLALKYLVLVTSLCNNNILFYKDKNEQLNISKSYLNIVDNIVKNSKHDTKEILLIKLHSLFYRAKICYQLNDYDGYKNYVNSFNCIINRCLKNNYDKYIENVLKDIKSANDENFFQIFIKEISITDYKNLYKIDNKIKKTL